ncbi:MAG: tetratricopeptide repeat protein, partial [Smithella sp.]
RRYSLVLLFFILGLMAKPMLVTLPFVLLLLDYWPLQRFQEITGIKPSAARDCSTYPIPLRYAFGIGVSTIQPDQKVQPEVLKSMTSDKQKKKSKKNYAVKETLEVKKPADPAYKWSLIYPLLWEKVPFFALVILSSIVTYFTVQSAGAIYSDVHPLVVRIGNAFVSYIAYMGNAIWPSNLAVFYPHPGVLIPWQVVGSVVLLIAITLVVFWRAKKSPYLATSWLWYAGTLVPVIGIVQVGGQAMADRFTYIPLIGLFIMVAWGVPELLKKWNHQKEILLTLSILIILCITLFDHTLKITDNNWLLYYDRGATYSRLGNYKQAIEDYSRAIEINPGFAAAYNNRSDVYAGLGNYRQAIEDLNRVIEFNPGFAAAYNKRGNAYNGLGNYRQAIEDCSRAIEIEPAYAEAYNNRGNAYDGLGNHKQAIEDYDRAIEIKPRYAELYYNRGIGYLNQGDNISGCRDARKSCELGNCKLLEAANTRGLCR